MSDLPHIPRRNGRTSIVRSLLTLALAVAVFSPTAAMAFNTADGGGGGRHARNARALDAFEIDNDLHVTVKLGCEGVVEEGVGTVGCHWRHDGDAVVANWQLWNLQRFPVEGSRNLVATLGADVTSYRDSNVEVPAGYLYALLGVDADGEIVARSRIEAVRLSENRLEHLRLTCHGKRPDVVADELTDERPLPDPSIGCGWSASEHPDAVGYVLYRSVDGSDRVALERFGLDVVSYVDKAVAWGHRYRYLIVAVDADGDVVGRSRVEQVALPIPHDRERDGVRDRPSDRASDERKDDAPAQPGDEVSDAVLDDVSDTVSDALQSENVATDRPADEERDRHSDHDHERPARDH